MLGATFAEVGISVCLFYISCPLGLWLPRRLCVCVGLILQASASEVVMCMWAFSVTLGTTVTEVAMGGMCDCFWGLCLLRCLCLCMYVFH